MQRHKSARLDGPRHYSLYVIHYTLLLPLDMYFAKAGHQPCVWVPILVFEVIVAASLVVHKTVELPARRYVLCGGARCGGKLPRR